MVTLRMRWTCRGLLASILAFSLNPAIAAPTVVSYQLVSKVISGRTTVDYSYRVLVSNMGPALIDVTGSVTSSSLATKVVVGSLKVGDISAGARALSPGTITIRQDRTVAYNPSVLAWTFVGYPGEGVPPDPGVAGTLTAEGVDIDADGVRDDIERFIARTYPNSERLRRALLQFAADYQQVMKPADSNVDAVAKTDRIFRSVDCAAFVAPSSYADAVQIVERQILNTMLRLRANGDFDDLVGGEVFSFGSDAPGISACRFDPSQLAN